MFGRNEKPSIVKIVAITTTVVLSIQAVGAILYKLFNKFFKITFECDNNCENCVEGCCDGEDDGCDCCNDDDFQVEVTDEATDAATEPTTTGGCGASVSMVGVAMVMMLGTCATFVSKKR